MKRIEVVAAILTYGEEILCMQRSGSKHPYLSYKYEFPGGKIEPGESRAAALRRELKEELDIDVAVREVDFYLTVQHQYPDFEIVMHSFLCKVNDKNIKLKEHADHRWLTRPELMMLDWAAADVPIARKLTE